MREIDVACARTATSSSANFTNINNNCKNQKFEETHKKLLSDSINSRQSTLDKFIGFASRNSNGPQKDNYSKSKFVNNNNNYRSIISDDGGEEKGPAENEWENVGFVKIDPEAAKTWIYPGLFFSFLCFFLKDICPT